MAAWFDFFCSNVKQMGVLLEEKKARRATEATSLRILFCPSLTHQKEGVMVVFFLLIRMNTHRFEVRIEKKLKTCLKFWSVISTNLLILQCSPIWLHCIRHTISD